MISRQSFRKHRRLSMAGGILAAVIIIITGFALLFPAAILGTFMSEEGSRRLSRELTISGPVDIDWHWSAPRVHIKGIRLANMPDSDEPDMLSIAEADFRIKIWKLLIGRLELPEMTLDRPRIVLEKKDNDQKNWNFPVFSRGEKIADAALPDGRGDFPIIGRLLVRDGSLIYRDATKDLELDLQLDSAQAEGTEGTDLFQVSGEGTLQDKHFELEARGGSLDILRDRGRDYPLTMSVTMGATKVALDGTFRDPVRMEGIEVILDLGGDNMADLFYLTGIPLPPTPPYKLSGTLGKDGKVWNFNDFNGKVGDSDLSGSITYDLSGEKGFLKGTLVSRVLDMDDLGGFVGLKPGTGAGETAAPSQEAAARREAENPRVLPDVPLNLNRLRSTNMDVTLNAGTIRAPGWPFRGGSVHFDLSDGFLRLDPLKLTLADGIVAGNIILDGRKDMPDVALNLDVRRLSLNRFFDKTRFEDLSSGYFGGHVGLKGQGRTLARVLASSDGRIVLLMSGGRISLLLIEAAGIDISEATPLLLGEDRSTAIRCGVADFTVTDGFLRSQAVVLDTDDTNLEGRAVIDLADETIDATLKANSKDKSLLAGQVPIRISGTLKNPSIGIEPVEAGVRGATAVVLGVVLTPLAAVIPFIEPGLGEDSDCGALIAAAKAHFAEPAAGGSGKQE